MWVVVQLSKSLGQFDRLSNSKRVGDQRIYSKAMLSLDTDATCNVVWRVEVHGPFRLAKVILSSPNSLLCHETYHTYQLKASVFTRAIS